MPTNMIGTSVRTLAHELLEALWDLEDLHRELISEATRVAETLEDEATA